MQFSTITSWARLIWDGLRTYGIDANAVFEEVGLDPEALKDTNGRYPVPAMRRLWMLAVERSGDPCFGLVAAEQWHPTTWHGLGFAWLASSTLEEGLERLARYGSLLSTAAEIRLTMGPEVFRLTFSSKAAAPVERVGVTADAAIANVVHMCRATCGADFNPARVEFIHEGTSCRQRRQEIFRAPVVYGAESNSLEISATVARKPLPRANAELAHANEQVISDYLGHLESDQTATRVKAALIDGLSSGHVTANKVAELLFMSQRTLQRKLEAEGTSFSAVLDETRHELAERFMLDRSLTLIEIAFLLGFSEMSCLSRSFKRWTGLSPTEFRNRG